jgi:acyl-CoA thioesterase
MGKLERDTTVTRLAPGRYSAAIDRGWWVERGPNGGYIAALLVRAMSTEVAEPARRLRSATVHYLRPPAEGPAEIEVVVERTGATLSTVTARLMQADRLIALAMAAFATDRVGPGFHDAPPPEVPVPEALLAPPPSPFPMPIRDRFEQRHCIGTGYGVRGEEAVTGGWLRLAEGGSVDELTLVAMSDAWFPAVFARLELPVGVPTVDLTVHIRNAPPEDTEWVLVRFCTRVSAEGFIEEDGELWHPDGTLLAQSRQLAVLLSQ